jgi:hypothetical protein
MAPKASGSPVFAAPTRRSIVSSSTVITIPGPPC